MDSHHVEFDSWAEVLDHIEDPVLRRNGKTMAASWPNARNIALSNHPPGLTFQDVHGRIPHQIQLAEDVDTSNGEHRDLTLMRRAIESMGIDVQIVFPQPMLEIGLHPSAEIETQLIFAYNRWFTSRILAHEPRIKSMLALPFGNPDACLRTIDEFAGKPGVVGFLITGQRQVGIYGSQYMPVYRALEERGLPLGFHAGPGLQHRPAAEPVRVGALAVVRDLQHDPPDELDHERAERAVPEAEGDLDRERAGVAAVHDAAARSRVPDAPVGRAAAQEAAERVHAGDVSTRRSRWSGPT